MLALIDYNAALFGALGLLFANKFLDTRVEAARAWRWMRGLIAFGVGGISLLVITRLHGRAAIQHGHARTQALVPFAGRH